MILSTHDPSLPALDHFERYYAEKIWEWIPEVYRHEDGLAGKPHVLRSTVEVLARQAAVARRSTDRLWEDQFIEFCDDWAIPYLGDLVGARLVHELNRRGRRVTVANNLFYRRRKGTLLVLERLIQDLTGWEGVVAESFRRLARMRHGLDPEVEALLASVTGTPPGGTAELGRPRGGDLLDGPFDEYFHTPDFRRLRGYKGRYNIPKVNFHLYRLRAFRVVLPTPFDLDQERFTFDPSGRDVPLFRPSQRPAPGDCRPVREWEITAPIPCRLLGAASYLFAAEAIPAGLDSELSPLAGERFVDEARLRLTLATVLTAADLETHIGAILAAALTEDSPKGHLLPEAVALVVGEDSGEPALPHQVIISGNLQDWGQGLTPTLDKKVVIDPERGRFVLLEEPVGEEKVFTPLVHYGFSGPIGAGTYDRRLDLRVEGVAEFPGGAQDADGHELEPGPIVGFTLPADGTHEFVNSKTYISDPPTGNVVDGVNHLWLQGANRTRPYLRLVPGNDEDEWTFNALPKPSGGDPEDDANRRLLTLEGLWVGIVPTTIAPQALTNPDDPCTPAATRLVLDGIYDRVMIRHSTLDPGGEQARIDPLQCTPIPAVSLEIHGQVEELIIESSIVGAISEATDDADPCSVGKLVLRDSIVQSVLPGVSALATRIAEVRMERVTFFGDVIVKRLYASEALIQGLVRVTDNQHGCFRFSAADDRPDKRLPPQFESHLVDGGIPNHWFVSRRFGDPGYAQLSDTVPRVVLRGAENGSEIGAFSSLLNPIKLDDLKLKVMEFMPFGLIAQYIHET